METIIESSQIPGTAGENIKNYEVGERSVTAIFWSAAQAAEFIKKYSAFKYSPVWYDQVGFAYLSVEGNKIIAKSSYHPSTSLIRIFESGLKLV